MSDTTKPNPAKITAGSFIIRGTIGTVDLTEKTFTIEPAPPYAFEKTGRDGSSEKLLLFVQEEEKPFMKARMAKRDSVFKLGGKFDLGTIVALKTEREKVEIGVSASSLEAEHEELEVVSIKIV